MPRDARLYMTFPNDFPWHPKVSRLDPLAKWTFVEMNGYSRMNDLDGVIPAVDAEFMWEPGALEALAKSHPARPLVIRDGDNYVIRDYAEHQQTKAQRDELAQKRSEAGRKGGLAKSQASASKRQADAGKEKQSQSPESESELEGLHTVSQSSHLGNREGGDGLTDAVAAEMVRALGVDPRRLVAHIEEHTGRSVTTVEAMSVATGILGRGDAKKPQAYVLGSITKSADEIRDQIDAGRPTTTPRRNAECSLHPHYPLPCDKCAAIAAERDTP